MRLYQCQTKAEQIRWSVEHLRKAGRLHDVSLWLGGVDHPMRIIAGAKVALRAEDRTVTKAMETVPGVTGEKHVVLAWRLPPNDGPA